MHGRSPKEICKSATYESIVAVGNFVVAMSMAFIGVGFSEATGLLDSSAMSLGEIVLSSLLGVGIMVPIVAIVAFVSDVIKANNHFDAAFGRAQNFHRVSSCNLDQEPKLKSEFNSFIIRILPVLITIGPSIIGALILGHTSSDELRQVAIALASGTVGVACAGVPAIIGARYWSVERESNVVVRAIRQDHANHAPGGIVLPIPPVVTNTMYPIPALDVSPQRALHQSYTAGPRPSGVYTEAPRVIRQYSARGELTTAYVPEAITSREIPLVQCGDPIRPGVHNV